MYPVRFAHASDNCVAGGVGAWDDDDVYDTWQWGLGPVSKSSIVLRCDALEASEEPGS